MRLLVKALVLLVCSVTIEASAQPASEITTLKAVHENALELVRAKKLPPPMVAWAFAKANQSGNVAYQVSKGSIKSFAAAFEETWLFVAAVPSAAGKSQAVKLGIEIARREWARTEADFKEAIAPTWLNPNGENDGVWRPTPAQFQNPLLPNWGSLSLFGAVPNQTLSNGLIPPAWNSSVAVHELAEVIRLGAVDSKHRTEEQTLIASFWAAGAGTVTPPGMWIQIALASIDEAKLSSVEARDLMQAVSMAMADAGIACWNVKFATAVWRPVTAAQTYGPTKAWLPLLATPPFPSYVSGHSSFSGAAATVLREALGERAIAVSTMDHPGVVRKFQSFTEAANEAGLSRIYGGIHYQSDNEDGLELGRRSACAVLERYSALARCN